MPAKREVAASGDGPFGGRFGTLLDQLVLGDVEVQGALIGRTGWRSSGRRIRRAIESCAGSGLPSSVTSVETVER